MRKIVLQALLLVSTVATFAGCARTIGKTAGTQPAYGAGTGEMDTRVAGVVPMAAAMSDGASAALSAVSSESAIEMARVEGHAELTSDPPAERHSMTTTDALRPVRGAGEVRASLKQMTAQAGVAPMPGMPAGSASRQAGSMTEMMGAPGLVPFDVMVGQAGKWMVGYQFMSEKMDGNLVGTRDISEATILGSFFATPTDMTMQMHMLMAMYAPTDRLTLMAVVPYLRKDMNHLTVGGARFAERTEGIGDIELRGMASVFTSKGLHHRLVLNGGVGLPTGSIDARMDGMPLEYPMQIGSGTFSLLPGFTYLGQASPWGWAADFGSTVRLGQNDNGYRLGNRYQSSISIARELAHGVSVSAGLRGEWWENISGADPLLDPADEPTKDPSLQGGKRLSSVLGVTFHPQHGPLEDQHFHLQFEAPVVESLDGPQLSRSWVIRLGWQLEF